MSNSFRVKCQECGKLFSTSKIVPQCPRCNSVDIELADEHVVRPSFTDQLKSDLRDLIRDAVDGGAGTAEQLDSLRDRALKVALMPNTRLALERAKGRKQLVEALGRASVDLESVR